MCEWSTRGLTLVVNGESHRSKLHSGDWVMAVASIRGGRESQDVLCACIGQNTLERDGGNVMALIDNDMPVPGDKIIAAT
jgi:hypothetical protein